MPMAHPLPLCLPQYYAECHGVIYVIDSTDEDRLSESKQAFGGYSPPGAGGLFMSSPHIPCVWSWAMSGQRVLAMRECPRL